MAPEYDELVELLIDGARYGDGEDVQTAIDQGANINGQDDQGRTAVHMAAANGHIDVLKHLIDAGASVTMTNAQGNTPLHWACLNNQAHAVKLLLEAGANPSALNNAERTPMDEALDRGFEDIRAIINESSTQVGGKDDEVDDVPDDAPEAGESGDMDLEDESQDAT